MQSKKQKYLYLENRKELKNKTKTKYNAQPQLNTILTI